MRILLVEDDLEQIEPIHAALSQAGHIVDQANTGEAAHWLITEKEYDLLILDWMLPDTTGVAICRHYRQAGKVSPVLILTARDTTQDKVEGLDAGADDYLIKPIDLMELLARVRAMGRRSPLWQGDSLTIADLQLHRPTLTLERQTITVQLSVREFQLLEYLMRHPRQVMSREQIELTLWEDGAEPESNAISTLVRRLRRRLQQVNADPWLETVYGTGYRFNPPDDSA